jgi:hypothetical protein
MTATTAPRANVIAFHVTTERWAISIIKRSAADYAVVRVSPDNKYLALASHQTEANARVEANRQWLADRG